MSDKIQYGPWSRTKTIRSSAGGELTTVEYGATADGELEKMTKRAEALEGLLRRWLAQCDDDGDASREDDEALMGDTRKALSK